MATSLHSDFKVFNEQFQGGFVDTLMQAIDGFNEAARGALRVETRELIGHYEQEAFWDEVSAIARRDIDSTSSATATKLTQDEFVGVKLNRKNGPYETNLDAFRKIGEDIDAFGFVIGELTAKAMPTEQMNTALAALEAKLDAVAALEHDATDGTIATSDLVSGLSKAGDSANGVVLWVMHSKPWFDLLNAQLTGTASVFGSDAFGGEIFQGIPATLNRPVFVTDSASLVETDGVSSGVDAYSTLGLRASAARLDISEPPVAVMEGPLTGQENLIFRWQAEYAYNLKLLGSKWDITNGGANPTDAAVATAGNWDTVVADNKGLPGIIVKSR